MKLQQIKQANKQFNCKENHTIYISVVFTV